VDPLHTVFAIGAKLGIASLNPSDFTVQELTMFPQFHSDVVREIALSQNSPNLVLSGGFDGKVFVTDISRLYVDIQKNEQKSENSLYPCSDVVGSVRWHPTDAYLASCTTDGGSLHIFDIRTDKKRPALIYNTSKKHLYSHDYRDQHTLLLGFGDGQVQVFDSRTRKNLIVFQDPYLKAVGDIRFNRLSKHFAFFGIPEFTLWQYNDNEMRLWTHHYLSQRPTTTTAFDGVYKTNGEFLPSTSPAIAVTDSRYLGIPSLLSLLSSCLPSSWRFLHSTSPVLGIHPSPLSLLILSLFSPPPSYQLKIPYINTLLY
jgi:WD40 repeat protein